MKITQKNLRQIINEEARRFLKEQRAVYDEDIPPGEDDGYEVDFQGPLPQRDWRYWDRFRPSRQPSQAQRRQEVDSDLRRLTDEEFDQMRARSEEGAAEIDGMAVDAMAAGMIDKYKAVYTTLQDLDMRVRKLEGHHLEGGSTPGLPMKENFERFGAEIKSLTKRIP